jgi:hypothetical protein
MCVPPISRDSALVFVPVTGTPFHEKCDVKPMPGWPWLI